nr:ATP-grasp domain-containing protein [Micromonospora sp. DSM 115978]
MRSTAELLALPRTGDHIVQQYLPGQEYSLDVMASQRGRVCAVVPRLRLKIDSGIAVAGRTEHDAQLEWFGAAVANAVGLTGVGNVQCRRDEAGVPRLFEVNARFPGTMPLTVAAGVDVPTYLVAEAVLGTHVPERMPFLDVAMVRHWEDVVVDPAAFVRPADPRSSLSREFAATGSTGASGATGVAGVGR